MAIYRIGYAVGVAPAHGGYDRQAALAAPPEYGEVAQVTRVAREGQFAQPVGGKHVHPRLVEDKIRLKAAGNIREGAAQQFEVGIAIRTGRQSYVEVRGFFMQRIIVAAMHGEGEHLRTVAKNGSRAITLMHIEVDNEHFAAEAVPEQVFGGDGEVVEHAKAFATVGIGVVGATREVGCRTGMQGLPRRS